jgi:nucleoside-diphosphate-sugar epimerase
MLRAAVTGARGMIGSQIVSQLIDMGWHVNVLTRSNIQAHSQLTVIQSDINSDKGLLKLIEGVDAVFHCAAEIYNEQKMYSTNVEGTNKLMKLLLNSKVSYLCHLSSAGVTGATSEQYITEDSACYPNNIYEKSKYESELLVSNSNLDINLCILRPTNVISSSNIGILTLPKNNNWIDKVKVIVKGREAAHIVYAKEVANAALYFLNNRVIGKNIFIVSYDDEPINTIIDIYNLYQSICGNNRTISYALPLAIPHFFRKLYRGNSLHGRVRFQNDKLKKNGFVFEYGVRSSLEDICKYAIKEKTDVQK